MPFNSKPCTLRRAWSAALSAAVLSAWMAGSALAVSAPGAATPAPSQHAPIPDSSVYFRRPPVADTSFAARQKRALEKVRMGRALENAHEPAAAIIAYQTATEIDPDVPEANYRMGMLFLTVNQIKAAAACFVQEVKHHPENQAAARQLGIAYARLGDSQIAIKQLEPIVAKHPEDADAWAALG
ncbi:MAG: tetratricopeptide repeat protein, partial [Candidatus Eiseniibacteriota bacterium]